MAMEIDQQQEQQVKEFLKRAEVKTMRKDLQKLREFDALKERDKIAKLKTVEEQQIEIAKKQEVAKQKAKEYEEKQRREEILGKNIEKEREAEKDLKKYTNESEKQQIFLLESERVKLEDQIKSLEAKEYQELALQKNKLLSQQYVQETKLKVLLEDEKKIENEQKYIEEKESQSAISTEKKALEERRSDLENQRQEIEKKRWALEKVLGEIANKISELNKTLEDINREKNKLHNRIKEIDNSIRETYSGVIAKEQEKRMGQQEEQKIRAAELAKTKKEEKENIQREQWLGVPVPKKKSFQVEEEQRKKFIQTIEEQTKL